LKNPDSAITVLSALLQELWGRSHAEDVHYVRVHMGNVRKKIEADPSQDRTRSVKTTVARTTVRLPRSPQ